MKLLKTLRLRIPILLFVFGLLAIFFNYEVSLRQELDQYERNVTARLISNGIRLSGMAQYFLGKAELGGAEMELKLAATLPELRLALLCDAADRIVLSNEDRWRGRLLNDSPLAGSLPLVSRARATMNREVEVAADRQSVVGAFPFLPGAAAGQIQPAGTGVIVLQFDLSKAKNEARSVALRLALLSGSALLLLCLLLWGLLHRTLTRRVHRLVEATGQMARGNLEARAGLRDGDELGHISEAVDRMAGEMRRHIEALRDSEALFRNMADHAPVMIWITDPTGSCTYISQSWLNFTGQTLEAALDHGWVEALHPDDRNRAHDAFLAANARGEAFRLEYRLRRKDGEYCWVIDSAAPRFSESGEFLGYIGSVIDITDRREAEEALSLSQARMSGIIASAMDAIITVDAGQRIRVFNAAAEQMFRCPAAEAIGETLDRFIPERFRDAHRRHVADFGCSKVTKRSMGSLGAVFGRRADGEEFPVEASISQIETAGQKLFTVILRDITRRNEAEERLIEQAALLNHARDAILVLDLDDRILFWNQGAERIYGWTAEEAVGRAVEELIYRGDSSECEQAKRAALEKGEWSGELRQVAKDGKQVVAECRCTLVRDAGGQPKSILSINTDVTEQKRLEAQFLRAQRLESIGTLASGIAHDLNNILSPITMGVELLQMKLADESSQRMLEVIRQSAERGGDLVKQVLSFAKGAGGQKTTLQPRHLIKEIAKVLDQTFPKNIVINHSLPPDLATINGDPTQLHQVLMNLCVNARDAMPDGGTLTIAAENLVFDQHYAQMNPEAGPGPYVLITVTDTGTGMPLEILDRIFDPFFTSKEPGKGTGLGLATVQGIVKSHGGFVNVYSELGRGTQFRIYLPAIATSQTAQAAASAPNLPAGHGQTILVVDDEASVREITRTTLETFGYRVLAASEGAEAVALYVSHQDEVAAVLTDMMMPLMDGSATIRALMRINPRVTIIASSGWAEGERTAEVAQLGVKTFLPKPYTAEKLLVTLDGVIGKATAEAREA